MSAPHNPKFRTAFAETPDEIRAVQRLRYDVFVSELGADGPGVDHDLRLEQDEFDPHCRHLTLHDDTAGRLVGVYRLMSAREAAKAGRFYSENEYDLSGLIGSGRNLLELGRSCVAADYRGGAAMHHMWCALAEHAEEIGADVLFGVASFHGTDIQALAGPLSLLHHQHLASPPLQPVARAPNAARMDLLEAANIDRIAAMRAIPALIKAYLRLGGQVGSGAWIDHDFNTTDVCLVLDTQKLNARQMQIYRGRA